MDEEVVNQLKNFNRKRKEKFVIDPVLGKVSVNLLNKAEE